MSAERMADDNRKRRALGRGLGALIPDAERASEAPSAPRGSGLLELPLDDVVPNRNQPRKDFEDPRIQELAISIAADGIIQPIVVRKVGNKYELIAGERRWRASRVAGKTTIPALVKDVSDLESLVLALEENIQRADLNPLEEAMAYEQLTDEFGLTQEEVARRVGRERSTVANTLRLLRLPETIKEDLVAGTLSMGHARALLALDDPELMLVARRDILEQGLSVRAAEALVTRLKKGRKHSKKAKPARGIESDPDVQHVVSNLRERFGTKVSIRGSAKKGKIELEYYSTDDLNRLLKLLGR